MDILIDTKYLSFYCGHKGAGQWYTPGELSFGSLCGKTAPGVTRPSKVKSKLYAASVRVDSRQTVRAELWISHTPWTLEPK
jgi:hypothetical protein